MIIAISESLSPINDLSFILAEPMITNISSTIMSFEWMYKISVHGLPDFETP